jgi:bacterioferritin
LDAVPVVGVGLKPQLGKNVQEQLEIDLKDEHDAVRDYNAAAQICQDMKDNGSRDLFERLLKDEERHVDFLETQLYSIKEMGIANYLAQQING